ncbi:hypothetical protein TNCV_3449631 [Trichonephila clavipes]|nr:hypothetical protein TNCV_3449631 [Trichonephila clavipes]
MVAKRLAHQHMSVSIVDEMWHRVEAAWTSVPHFTCGPDASVPRDPSSIEDWTKDDVLRSCNLIHMRSSCMCPDWSGIRQNGSEDEFVDKQFIFSAQCRVSCN